jgi:L-fuconolactonase
MLRMVPLYLFDELMADIKSGHNVIGTVFMECGAMYKAGGEAAYRCVGETEFVGGVAAMGASGIYGDARPCAGIVGHVDMTLGSAAKGVLEAQIATGNGRFKGIRHACASDPDPDVLGPLGHREPGLYRSDKFREGFAQLAPLGMSFDAWLLEPQLGDVLELARAFPNTPIVLDHVGTPLGIGAYTGKREERFGVWRDSIRALAALPNVSVKLGGLAMVFPGFSSYMASPTPSSESLAQEWKPYIDACIQAFGPTRCMFESNFPVDRGTCPYDVLWNAFKVLAKGYSADEKTAMFSDTARRVYRLDI